MSRIAIFPGTFDPLTLGHLDVVERSSRMFDQVVVAVGKSRDKNPLFPVEERLEVIREACGKMSNVTCNSFEGLVVEYAKSIKASVLVRGIRSGSDFDYEMQMALMNRSLYDSLETIFIPTNPQYSHISSSLAKEIAHHGGDVSLLLPESVVARLKGKIS